MPHMSSLLNSLARTVGRGWVPASNPQRVITARMSTAHGYSYLSRHPDEKKPSLPYQPGTKLRAQRYTPPLSPSFYHTWASEKMQKDILEVHPLQLCLQYPPAKGTPGSETFQVQIQERIRVQDLARAQIARVNILKQQQEQDAPSDVLPASTSADIVAKFYDPLYNDFEDSHPDPFANCDAAFAHGTAAYTKLQPLYGTVVPRFYGSYSVDIPLPGDNSHSRPVRAILYEYVRGITLEDMEVHQYSTSQRQAIMSAILDADSMMWQLDVSHGDLHPRNIILVSANEGERAEIRLIDFDMARCGLRAKDGHVPTIQPEPRCNIVKQWLDEDMTDSMIDFAWLVDWPWNQWLENEYAKTKM